VSRRAVFLDRDGTLVHPRRYPSSADDLRLYEGIGPELCAVQQRGFLLVVITNQAGIARGLFTEEDLEAMNDHLRAELARLSVRLDGIYHCPHHVDGVIPALSISCDCRKPAPGMLLCAASDLDIDLTESWFVGDILDDIEAGRRAGCRTVLVDLGTEPPPTKPERMPHYVARDTVRALHVIQAIETREQVPDPDYRPSGWSGTRGEPVR